MDNKYKVCLGGIVFWMTLILLGMLLFANLSCKGLKIERSKEVKIEIEN